MTKVLAAKVCVPVLPTESFFADGGAYEHPGCRERPLHDGHAPRLVLEMAYAAKQPSIRIMPTSAGHKADLDSWVLCTR
jgi:hypothetical protein